MDRIDGKTNQSSICGWMPASLTRRAAPAAVNVRQGLAWAEAVARHLTLKTIPDMVRQAGELRFIVKSECLNRPDGLPGLRRVYGNFSFKSQVIVAGAGSLRYAALMQG